MRALALIVLSLIATATLVADDGLYIHNISTTFEDGGDPAAPSDQVNTSTTTLHEYNHTFHELLNEQAEEDLYNEDIDEIQYVDHTEDVFNNAIDRMLDIEDGVSISYCFTNPFSGVTTCYHIVVSGSIIAFELINPDGSHGPAELQGYENALPYLEPLYVNAIHDYKADISSAYRLFWALYYNPIFSEAVAVSNALAAMSDASDDFLDAWAAADVVYGN